ncbi:MAG: tetratricopeptide repeat protein [Gammaproteobacteria bacterium]|nr:tetratricopeptide repeat protein [Gammaproteobacteria bacterium]
MHLSGNRAGGDINVTVNSPPEQLETLKRATVEALRTIYEPQVKALGDQLSVTQDALTSFFQILREQNVPLEKLPDTLATIAQRYHEMQERLAALNPEDPTIKALIDKARTELEAGHFDLADALLSQAEAAEEVAARQAEQLARDAQAAADQRWLNAAAARAERGELSLTRLDYLQAAEHFRAASEKVPTSASTERGGYLRRCADALQNYGDQQGDNAVLLQALDIYRQALADLPRERMPLDWAMTQNNLGTALLRLGEREAGTARLEEAVTAYRAALEEVTRERVPLTWALTQTNLGNALQALGEREANPARLEEAMAAFQAALEEVTRDRVPLDWAMTQTNLGTALQTLGEWEAGTARLKEAVTAYRAALEERTRDRVPLDWAMTQSNLGNALQALGIREAGTARLEEAVTTYRVALEEVTRERVPLYWAGTQNNLGVALARLGEREANPARLEEAVSAYRAALEERTRERVPLDWAQTQRNLARAYRALHDEAKAEAICQELRDANLGYRCN